LFLFSCYAQKPDRGIDGTDGKNGLNGAQGIQGDKGNDGLNGKDGPNIFIQGQRIKPKYSSVSFEDGTSYLYLGGQSNDPKSIIWVDTILNFDCNIENLTCPNPDQLYCLPVPIETSSPKLIYIGLYQGGYYPDTKNNNFFWVYTDSNCTNPYMTNNQIIDKSSKYFFAENNGCMNFYTCSSFTTNISSAYYFDTDCKSLLPSFVHYDCTILKEVDINTFVKVNFLFETK
jgi:hypothetical protein